MIGIPNIKREALELILVYPPQASRFHPRQSEDLIDRQPHSRKMVATGARYPLRSVGSCTYLRHRA